MQETRNSIKDIWGSRTPYFGDWPVRIDEFTEDTPDHWVPSACLLCSNGCGIDIGVKNGRIVGVRGRANDRVNHGRLGPKGLHGWEANNSKDRLTKPLIRRNGELSEATWEEAMNLIVHQSNEVSGAASRYLGRENRYLHQCRPHGTSFAEGGGCAR
jgi:ferredoxin-nitrate reductase